MQDAYIAAAVEPQRAEIVARAKWQAEKHYAGLLLKLEAAGFDLNVCAPYANGNMSRPQYMQANALRAEYVAFTVRADGAATWSRNGPFVVRVEPARVAVCIAYAEAQAHIQFDSYINKLSGKIGATRSASLNDSYVWNGSVLTVDSVERGPERWATKIILNRSVLGKWFHQWPTRRLA